MMKLPNVPKSICYVADVTFKVSHLYFFFFVQYTRMIRKRKKKIQIRKLFI